MGLQDDDGPLLEVLPGALFAIGGIVAFAAGLIAAAWRALT